LGSWWHTLAQMWLPWRVTLEAAKVLPERPRPCGVEEAWVTSDVSTLRRPRTTSRGIARRAHAMRA
jgi:hypothetical protein